MYPLAIYQKFCNTCIPSLFESFTIHQSLGYLSKVQNTWIPSLFIKCFKIHLSPSYLSNALKYIYPQAIQKVPNTSFPSQFESFKIHHFPRNLKALKYINFLVVKIIEIRVFPLFALSKARAKMQCVTLSTNRLPSTLWKFEYCVCTGPALVLGLHTTHNTEIGEWRLWHFYIIPCSKNVSA